MNSFFVESTFFALVISLLGYETGAFLKKKTGLAIFNPLLVAIVLVIIFLLVFHIDYSVYEEGRRRRPTRLHFALSTMTVIQNALC